MELIKGVTAVLQKDLKAELRSRYALHTVLAFVGASMLIILFSLRANQLPPTPKSGLIWIVILFAALTSLSRSFISETERYTFDLLRLSTTSIEVYTGKLAYNFLFALSINFGTFILYIFLLGLPVSDPLFLSGIILLGTLGFTAVSSLLAAIVSQADRKGAIFSILSIPLLFPLILLLVEATEIALMEKFRYENWSIVLALVGYGGVTLTAGILLFEYIWED